MEPPPCDVQLPNNGHLAVRWGNDGNITTSVANWIPPNDNCPLPAAARPTKKILNGIQHANEIVGKLKVPTDFHGITRPPYSPPNEPDHFDATQKTPPNYLPRLPPPKNLPI
jgi:hypothetical protein